MLAKIEQLLQEVENLTASNAEELEALRIKYLSKKGIINALMADFRNVPAEQKKEVGMKLNELKNHAQERINTLKEAFECQDNSAAELDLTRTAYPIELGTRHPLSIVRNEIINIFNRLGFTIADGPEVEDDWHVFSSMNFPEDHPARDSRPQFSIIVKHALRDNQFHTRFLDNICLIPVQHLIGFGYIRRNLLFFTSHRKTIFTLITEIILQYVAEMIITFLVDSHQSAV